MGAVVVIDVDGWLLVYGLNWRMNLPDFYCVHMGFYLRRRSLDVCREMRGQLLISVLTDGWAYWSSGTYVRVIHVRRRTVDVCGGFRGQSL